MRSSERRALPLALRYEQAVPYDGFEWRQPTSKLRHCLLRQRAAPGLVGRGYNRYRPFETKPTLYREFAEIDRGRAPTPSGILAFANVHGRLGVDHDLGTLEPLPNEVLHLWGTWERLETWEWEIGVMRHALRVWEVLRDQRASGPRLLSQWFRSGRYQVMGPRLGIYCPTADPLPIDAYLGVQPDPSAEQLILSPSGQAVGGGRDPGLLGEAKRGQFAWWLPIGPLAGEMHHRQLALAFLSLVVSNRLRQHVVVELLSDGSSILLPGCAPNNLLGVIWLQLAMAMEGSAAHRQCEQCKTWFEVPSWHRGMAQRARFCSARCRVRSFRANAKLPVAARGRRPPRGRTGRT